MNFNSDDYSENVNYCEYVFNKNKKLNLGLDNPIDIQTVANYYVDEIIELNDGYIGNKTVENDLVLFEVVDEFLASIKNKKFDPIKLENNQNNDRESSLQSQTERLQNSRGGLEFDALYEDFGSSMIL